MKSKYLIPWVLFFMGWGLLITWIIFFPIGSILDLTGVLIVIPSGWDLFKVTLPFLCLALIFLNLGSWGARAIPRYLQKQNEVGVEDGQAEQNQ